LATVGAAVMASAMTADAANAEKVFVIVLSSSR
jgi:hypothetical protein